MKDKIVQIIERNGYIHGLSELGNVYRLCEPLSTDDWWSFVIESPEIVKEKHDLTPTSSKG